MKPSDLGIGQLFESIGDAVIVADIDAERIVLWNPAAEAIFGYSAAEALDLPLAQLVPHRLRTQHQGGLARYRATGQGPLIDAAAPVELPALSKSGEEISIELTLTPLNTAPQPGRFVLAIGRDIRARRYAGALSRVARLAGEVDAEQLLTDLLDEMVAVVGGDAGGVYIWDEAQGGLVDVRNSLPHPFPLIPPGHGLAGRVWVEQTPIVVNDYQAEENVIEAAARARIHAGVVVPLNHEGQRLGALGISSYDPQKRFTAQDVEVLQILASTAAATLVSLERSRQLRENEARFRLLAENARDVIFRYRVWPSRGFDYISPAAVHLTGYAVEELYADYPPGHGFRLVHPDDQPFLDEIARSGQVPDDLLMIRWIHKQGQVIWTEQRHAPVYDQHGRLVAIEAIVRDVTGRRRAEEEREQLRHEQAARREAEAAVRLRDEFLSIAAHDLKTPVTGLRGAAQLLLRRLDRQREIDPAYLRRMLDLIDQQSKKLGRLITQLLEVSRFDAGKLVLDYQQIDLTALATEIAETLQSGTPRHQIAVQAAGPVAATLDPLRIEQVIYNLLDNAIKFSPDGGPIEVAVSRTDDGVCFAVRDGGIGIPPEHRPRIFERFHQAHIDPHAPGMGIGLFICRQIVELHGGRISVEIPSDGGTRFVVVLPDQGIDSPLPATV